MGNKDNAVFGHDVRSWWEREVRARFHSLFCFNQRFGLSNYTFRQAV